MRFKRTSFLLALGLAGGLVPLTVSASTDVGCVAEAPPPLAFEDRIYIDTTRAGGEPVAVTAPDGSISVSAHAGTTHLYKDPMAAPGYWDFLGSYYNQTLNWRSDDGGRSWTYVGTAGLPTGPHSATSTGFSDPDYDIDLGGNIYNTEIDLANVAVFTSTDYGQSYNIANGLVTAGDRPWVTAGEAGEVYLYVNLPKQLWRSANLGVTWEMLPTPPVDGKSFRDPLNPEKGLIGPIGSRRISGIAISQDKARSWQRFDGTNLAGGTQFFGTIAVDRAGNVYAVTAGGYTGPNDRWLDDGFVEFNYFERDPETLGGSWGEPVRIETDGDAMWPWIIAGDDGRVALTWLQRHADGVADEFFVHAAYTLNGTGSIVECSDGSHGFAPPAFAVVDASNGVPVHIGQVCQSGTACNANTAFEDGDRRLGDFFSLNFDLDGTIYIVSGDTTRPNPLGGPKPVGNPIFIKQADGARLLEASVEPLDTPCLGNLPLCD